MASDFIDCIADAQFINHGAATITTAWTATQNGYAVFGASSREEQVVNGQTIFGNAATELLSIDGGRTKFFGLAVTAGSGNVVSTMAAAFGVGVNWGGLLINSDNVVSDTDTDAAGGHGEPLVIDVLTIATGGLGLYLAVSGGTTGIPATWASATRIAALEDAHASGNTVECAGAIRTTAGTVSTELSAAGEWSGFSGGKLVGLAFGPAAGGAVGAGLLNSILTAKRSLVS